MKVKAPDDRTSFINLDGIARQKVGSPRRRPTEKQKPARLQGNTQLSAIAYDQQVSKSERYDQLYSKRKRQIDRADKTKEDYEFER